MSAPFFFDEFFVPDSDPGVTYNVPIRGRVVPIVCKRGLSLKDKEDASASAIKRHVDEESGRLVVDGIDEFRLNIELLSRTIKSWPFVFRDGRPVPVTPENIAAFVSEGADRLVQFIAKGNAVKEEEATGPFDAGSDGASSTPAADSSDSSPAASPSA